MKTLTVVGVAVAAFVLLASAVDVVQIDGESMAPVLRSQQVVLVNRLAFGFQLPLIDRYIVQWDSPRPGDVVFFHNRFDGSITVKRCIAVAGDRVELLRTSARIADSRVDLSPFAAERLAGKTHLGIGEIFVVGDNRIQSQDSRHYGPIRESDVIGVLLRLHNRETAG